MSTAKTENDSDPATESNRLRGTVLRSWRELYGQSQLATAAAAEMSDANLSDWELGHIRDLIRAGGLRRVRLIGQYLDEPHALPALWSAVGTSDAMRPRSDWSFNFENPGPPCWLWVRSRSDVVVDLQWGMAIHGQGEVPAGRGGLLIQFPTSVRNPPLEAALTDVGWVDAGPGEIPPEVAQALGAQWVEAQDLQDGGRRPRLTQNAPTDLDSHIAWLRWWADELGVRWSLVRPHLWAVLRPAPAHALDGADIHLSTLEGGLFHLPSSSLQISGHQAQVLREARGLSREQAAHQATEVMPELPVSREAIRRLEVEGRTPPHELTLARLDRLYQADGRFAVERTFRSQREAKELLRGGWTRRAVRFPSWWLGPVWLRPIAPAGRASETTVTLRWGPWVRKQRTTSGLVLTTRKAPPPPEDKAENPLYVLLPDGWSLEAGVGTVPAALDVGRYWQPAGLTQAKNIVRQNVEAVNRALGKRPPLRHGSGQPDDNNDMSSGD